MSEDPPQSPPVPATGHGRTALVFGGSGQIGAPLLARLAGLGWDVRALSREPRPPRPGVRWLHGELAQPGALPAAVDAILSCGPLDAFSAWFARGDVACRRVLAFGSTSVDIKQASADAAERDVARRLREAEARLFDAAAKRGVGATVLRPTLVYGAGRDATLTRIAGLARRLHGFALPSDAVGLRQPVHVDDLAAAAIACLDAAATHGRAYALPGGETLPYREMVARVLAALPSRPRLWTLPPPLFRALLAPARRLGVAAGFNDAALARMRDDLVFDAALARRDFGYAPRRFAPTADMLTTPASP
ncbi:nucleoside-diphosphate sugar epimerase [Luteimonas marina]|uniref:Nucleoside-diphosphate sugar epimerase n=1 Tax=Luteimonas marina TaxID=488485 RepID=A0A5C5TYD3_9GAMM|nr:NAD-dependent epimerase/dehydratase family protein [Luteimonas marina]TWT18677.1 nucleoside-diphosphate sugar epimerase [Luteimonas marina]